jgi:transcription elongation factor GreA
VKVLDKNGCNINEVGVGTEVKVKVGGKTKKLQIVSEVEADPTKNKISDKSPLGQALKKAKKGDKIRLDVHDREVVIYEVVDIC